MKLIIIREYLDKGAYINIRDHKKWTPLHCAAMVGNVEMTQILLDHKADTQALDDMGRTPFDVAFEYKNYQGELRYSILNLIIG